MRALQIVDHSGPDSALALAEIPLPTATHELAPDDAVLIDVHSAGVSFPELLQTRGAYQITPPLPFVPGGEVAGVVRTAPPGSGFVIGDRVAAYCMVGGFAETVSAPSWLTVPLSEELTFDQGAGLILNYHTAYFALVNRGAIESGETVLVHGAAGGIGTAVLQIANGLGARTIAIVSTAEKEKVARAAGAHEVVRSDGAWKDAVVALGGADLVVDPVGGDRFADSLRALRDGGRLVVVGFAAGVIPEVKVNRLLLRNVSVIGAGWGAYVFRRPEASRQIGAKVNAMVNSGTVRPMVTHRYPLERASDALRLLDERQATGKIVLSVAEPHDDQMERA